MPNEFPPTPEAEDAAGYMAQIKLFLGADSSPDALARLQALQRAFDEARRTLGSVYVISVIMGGGAAMGVQLPAGRHTEDAFEQMADGLLQGAMHLRELAKQTRAATKIGQSQ